MKRRAIMLMSALGLAGCPPSEPTESAPVQSPAQAGETEGSKSASKPASTPDVVGKEVTYRDGDVELKGFLAYDAKVEGQRPGVLVVHEWWGHNDYARARARQLAEMGYTALAVDMYGDGKHASHPDDAQKFAQEVLGNMKVGVSRFDAARKFLEAHETTNPEQTAAMGYCFGGGIVLHMARTGADLDVVGAFHAGGLSTSTPVKKGVIKGKVFVAHGEADPFVKPEVVEAFKKEMNQAEVEYDFRSYPGVKHSFTNPDATETGKKFNLPLEYDEEADRDSWERFSAVLKAEFS